MCQSLFPHLLAEERGHQRFRTVCFLLTASFENCGSKGVCTYEVIYVYCQITFRMVVSVTLWPTVRELFCFTKSLLLKILFSFLFSLCYFDRQRKCVLLYSIEFDKFVYELDKSWLYWSVIIKLFFVCVQGD